MIVLDRVSSTLAAGRLRKCILDDVSLSLPTDERLAILGHEGAGKSTLIRLLSGALLPGSGSIRRHARVSFPVGFSGGYRRGLSAYENIAHAAQLYGADVDEVVNFVSRLTGIDAALDEDYGDLPQHLRVRLVYAVSYAIPFDVYLIDNKVAVGDQEFRARCERVYEARMQEAGCILTTSLSRYARRFGTRIALLTQGKLVLYDDMERAIHDYERLERPAVAAGISERIAAAAEEAGQSIALDES